MAKHDLLEQTTDPIEPSRSVECLGMTFRSDKARRAHFLEKLKEKLPALRRRSDFPLAEDEDILRLSDPPYYTACPNPFLGEFVEHHGWPYDPTVLYHREPFAVDVSEGKTDQLYRAHGYHTKVPHLAIVPSILHYTKPGDIVLDGFCGSGMTGVAAQWCGTAPLEFRRSLEQRWDEQERGKPEWGGRRVILGDLSPAATFITANYNLPFSVDSFATAAQQLLEEIEEEIGWMYETLHTDGKTKGRINYTVWSEVFSCPECTGDIVFTKAALDSKTKQISKTVDCPSCGARASKEQMDLQLETFYDAVHKRTDRRPKRVPVIINYSVGKRTFEKEPDKADIELSARIGRMEIPAELPTGELPDCQMTRVGTHADDEYTLRPPHVSAAGRSSASRAVATGKRSRGATPAKHAALFRRAGHLGYVDTRPIRADALLAGESVPEWRLLRWLPCSRGFASVHP